MGWVVVLDSGPFGLISGQAPGATSARCQRWVVNLLAAGARVIVPEIADYEIRRELLRRGATAGLAWIDRAIASFVFAPIARDVMLRAAEFWGIARRGGYPAAGPDALDCDAIIAATAELASVPGDLVTVATGNAGHLGRFVDAQAWDQVTP